MVEVSRIEKGVARYLDNELAPKLPGGSWKQFGVGAVSALVAKRGGQALDRLKTHPMAAAFGLVDQAGCIDVDVLREIASERIPDAGLQLDVPMLGRLTIYQRDIEKLYGYIVGV